MQAQRKTIRHRHTDKMNGEANGEEEKKKRKRRRQKLRRKRGGGGERTIRKKRGKSKNLWRSEKRQIS